MDEPTAPRFDEATVRGLTDSVRWISLGAVLVFVAFIIARSLLGLRTYDAHEIVADAAMVALAAICHQVVGARRDDDARAHGAAFVLGLGTLANVAWSSAVMQDAGNLHFVAFIIVGIGAMVLAWWPLVAIGAVASTVAIITALSIGDANDLFAITLAMVSSLVVAVALVAGRRRSATLVMQLRRRDGEARDRLAFELEQRTAAEAEQERMRAQRAELAEKLEQGQRLESLGTLAGGIAHDMNNLLAAITSVAEAARHDADAPELREDLDQILTAAHQGSALTRNLLGFARRGKQRSERLRLPTLTDEVVGILRRTLPKGIVLDVEHGRLPPVMGDSGQLAHVAMNLCINAADALGARGRIRIATARRQLTDDAILPEGTYACLVVEDDGPGMDAETMSHVFEPFFSTKSEGEHSGLGLSMVFGTARQHGGDVRIESELGGGTKVTVWLPAAEEEADSTEVPLSVVPPAAMRILVVDDEALVRRGVRRLLRTLGAEVEVADGGESAVALFRERSADFDVVMLDMAMPGMDGTETFHALRAIDPSCSVVIASGYPKGASIDALIAAGASLFLSKPFTHEDLRLALSSIAPAVRRAS